MVETISYGTALIRNELALEFRLNKDASKLKVPQTLTRANSIESLNHRWARSSFLEGGQKIFLLEGGHKKLKQRGSGGSHAKKFMAVLALFGQELVPAYAGEIFFFWANFFCLFLKKTSPAQNLIGGQKPFLRGVGVILNLRGGS